MLGATAAAGGGTRALFQLSQRIDAFLVNRFDDGALRDTYAAADDFGIGHFGDIGASVFQRAGKKELLAMWRQIFLRAQPIHVAMAVAGVANENGAGEFAVADRKLLVDTEGSVFVAYDVGTGRFFREVSCRENVHAHDLELRCSDRAFVARTFVASDGSGENFALLEKRSEETVARTVVFDALTDGKNVGMRRFHEVVDDDAAIDLEVGIARERNVGADTRSNDDDLGVNSCAVLESNALYFFVAKNCCGAALQEDSCAEAFHFGFEVGAAGRVE